MQHLQEFRRRDVISLPVSDADGWHLKQYAILSDGKKFDQKVITAAFVGAIERLPPARKPEDQDDNHGIGFQIVHFAEVAVVSPVFYWQWGNVLASIQQMRAPWSQPTNFSAGVKNVVACIWEMQIINFEVDAWTTTMLSGKGALRDNVSNYLERHLPSAKHLDNP